MPILQTVNDPDVTTEELIVHKDWILYPSSEGVTSVQFRSGSTTDGYTPTESGSYWSSLRVNFYLSASQPWKDSKWINPWYSFGSLPNNSNPQHTKIFW
jgi:hypothetical protein